jgi:hypothetical protein
MAIGERGLKSFDIATTFLGSLIPGRSKRDVQKQVSTSIPRVVGLEKKATNRVTDRYLEYPAALADYWNKTLHRSHDRCVFAIERPLAATRRCG